MGRLMEERQLLRLLVRGGLQLRLNKGISWICGATLLFVGVSVLLVLVARVRPELALGVLMGIWLAVVLIPLAGVFGFVRYRPALRDVALQFDRVAALQEHLTTWEEFLRRGLPRDTVSRSLALLQRAETLRRAEGLRPGRLVPLVLPGWSRVLWLALLLLGCAILVPEQSAVVGRRSADGWGEGDGPQGGSSSMKPLRSPSLEDAFKRIEVLTQSEKEKLAIACAQDVPEALKGEVLSEIEAKLGGLSDRDLSTEVRELLAELRRQVRGKDGASLNEGSATVTARPSGDDPGSVPTEVGVNVLTQQETLGLVRDRFPDVAEALQRYYRAE